MNHIATVEPSASGENYSLLIMGATMAVNKMAVVSMEMPSGGNSPSRQCRCLIDGTSEEGSSRGGEEVGAIGRSALGTVVRDLPNFGTPARWQGLLLLVWNYLGAFALLQ